MMVSGEEQMQGQMPERQRLTQQIAEFANSISARMLETGTAFSSHYDFNNFNDQMTRALAELVTTELIYYYRLSEVGCHLASAYGNEQSLGSPSQYPSPMSEPQTPRPLPESEDDGLDDDNNGDNHNDNDDNDDNDNNDTDNNDFQGPLQRTASMSFACPRAISPSPVKLSSGSMNQLAANLLIASGRVRQQIEELARFLGISIDALGAASFQNGSASEKIAYDVFTFMGGQDDSAFRNGETYCKRRGHAVSSLCEISKMTWALMNLCVMTNTFRFATDSPLFSAIKIDPSESVFGNNSWRTLYTVGAASTSANPNDSCGDDTPSHW